MDGMRGLVKTRTIVEKNVEVSGFTVAVNGNTLRCALPHKNIREYLIRMVRDRNEFRAHNNSIHTALDTHLRLCTMKRTRKKRAKRLCGEQPHRDTIQLSAANASLLKRGAIRNSNAKGKPLAALGA